jgi:D-cysteine desulfhydrase
MEENKEQLMEQGYRPYIIPEGASNGIGAFGYYAAMEEIVAQEKQLGLSFDAIVVAIGSGGTYAGLFLAAKLLGVDKTIYGFNVCDDSEYFRKAITGILEDSQQYLQTSISFSPDEINIVDGYVGRGYALGRPEERQLIRELATLEGVVLDPVYTGKAFYGLTEEIKRGRFREHQNILFIHTGGLFGLFPQHGEFVG